MSPMTATSAIPGGTTTAPSPSSYNANGPLIGEIWPNASQWLAGDQMDSVMNYRFRKNITGFVRNADWSDDNNNGTNNIPGLTPSQFDHAIRAVRDDYPLQATAAMLNLLDSHDVNRALYVMTETGDTGLVQAKQRLKLAGLFQFTYIGAPMVYYGDEVAVNSPSLTSSGNGPIGDPYTRPPYPWLDQAGDPTIYGPPDTNMQAYLHQAGAHSKALSGTAPGQLRHAADRRHPAAKYRSQHLCLRPHHAGTSRGGGGTQQRPSHKHCVHSHDRHLPGRNAAV